MAKRIGRPPVDPVRRLLQQTTYSASGCLEWSGYRNHLGYGQITLGSRAEGSYRRVGVHRFAYEHFVGPIPPGLHLDHLCRNPPCWFPGHLEPVTCRENLLRGDTFQAANAAKTHCLHGHPFDDANTYWHQGHRQCRACKALRQRLRAGRVLR